MAPLAKVVKEKFRNKSAPTARTRRTVMPLTPSRKRKVITIPQVTFKDVTGKSQTLVLSKRISSGANNSGISFWKNTQTSEVVIGKILNPDPNKSTSDSPILEAYNALLLTHVPLNTIRYLGTSYQYPVEIVPSMSGNKFSYEKDMCTAFYSFAGKTTVSDNRKTLLNLTEKLQTFIHNYIGAGSRFGITHNDMHRNNVMLNKYNDFVLIDYGRAHTFKYPTDRTNATIVSSDSSTAVLDKIKTQFHTPVLPSNTSYDSLNEDYNSDWRLEQEYMLDRFNSVNFMFDISTFCMNIYKCVCKQLDDADQRKLPVYFSSDEVVRLSSPFSMPFIGKFDPILQVIEIGVKFFYDYLKSLNPSRSLIGIENSGVFPYGFQYVDIEFRESFMSDYLANNQQMAEEYKNTYYTRKVLIAPKSSNATLLPRTTMLPTMTTTTTATATSTPPFQSAKSTFLTKSYGGKVIPFSMMTLPLTPHQQPTVGSQPYGKKNTVGKSRPMRPKTPSLLTNVITVVADPRCDKLLRDVFKTKTFHADQQQLTPTKEYLQKYLLQKNKNKKTTPK